MFQTARVLGLSYIPSHPAMNYSESCWTGSAPPCSSCLVLLLRYLISADRKRDIRRSFEEKLRFLSEERDYVEVSSARTLPALHRYRNEAYHRDRVRKETLRPVVLLFFELVCDLVVALPPSSVRVNPSEDKVRLETRYGISALGFADRKEIGDILPILKGNLPLSLGDLRDNLVDHLEYRFNEIADGVELISEGVYRKISFAEAVGAGKSWYATVRKDQFP
jgi:hypothetical protein